MKKFKLIFLISLIIFYLFISISIYANQIATTQDGKQVLLKSDGTWEYIKSQSQESYKIFKIGTTIKINNFQFCLNSARWSKEDDLSLLKPNHIYLILDCSVKNIGNKPVIFSSMLMLKLIDKESYSQDQAIFANTKGVLDGELSPNQTMRGEIAFEVETNQSYWEFIFKPDLTDLGQAIYSIKKVQVK